MPGNEVGDRFHNFFGQENLSQGQHHSQVADGSWPGLNNNLWVGSQRHIGNPLVSNLKNFGVQQSADPERGHGGQTSGLQHGLNFSQSALKPELARSQSHNIPTTLNGYMHGHQALQTRQNESNFLGMDPEYNRHNLSSRGLPIHDSQLGNGSDLNMRNSVHLESSESPVNYDFFGSQQQMSSQHPGVLPSLPRQQPGVNDMQLLQQQVMFKQIQEFQRQQQLHNAQFKQQERQMSSINQIPSLVKQSAGSQTSPLINGIPMQDAANVSWQRQLMGSNTNWLQHGTSPVMQGSSSGLSASPDQGQVRMMGLGSQHASKSLYGIPVSSTKMNTSQYSPALMDNPLMQQVCGSSSSVPGNQFVGFSDHVGLQDGNAVSRQGYRGKGVLSPGSGPASNRGMHMDYFQQVNTQQRSAPAQEFSERQEFVGPSKTLQEESVLQTASSQNAATLDPEEEKILFGSDDNLWDAFGRSNNSGAGLSNILDGTDLFGALPSLQSGTWSALMQSAVGEISSGDIGLQEGSALNVPDSGPLTANPGLTYVNDGSKQPSAWPDNNLQTVSSVNTRTVPVSSNPNTSINYGSVPGVQQSGFRTLHEKGDRLQTDSSHKFQQLSGGRTSLLKPISEGIQFYGNDADRPDTELNARCLSTSQAHQESMSSYNKSGQPCDRLNGWNSSESISAGGVSSSRYHGNESSFQLNQSSEFKNAMYDKMGHSAGIWKTDSVPNASEHAKFPQSNREGSNLNNAAITSDSSTARANQKISQQLSSSHNFNFWKNVDSSTNSQGKELPGDYQHSLGKSPQNFELSGNDGPDNKGFEHEMESSSIKDKVSEGFHCEISHQPIGDASDSRTLHGGKQKFGHASRKPSGIRKFQYHPMGDVDIDMESSYGTKGIMHSQTTFQQVSRGLTGHEQVSGHSKFLGPGGKSSMESEKGRFPGVHGDTKNFDEVPSKSVRPGFLSGTSAPSDRSVANHIPDKTAATSQNMLELLHKVDQSRELSKEQGSATPFSSSDRILSEMHETETSDGSVGHLQQNQFSISQGFGLQLAPPSQRSSNPDHPSSSHSSSKAANSPSLAIATSDIGKKGMWFNSSASAQSSESSHERSQIDSKNNMSGTSGQIGHQAYNIQGNYPAGISSGFPYHRSSTGGQVTASQFVNASCSRFASQSRQIDGSGQRVQSSQSAMPSVSKTAAHDDGASSAENSHSDSKVQYNARPSTQQFPVLEAMPVSQPFRTPGMSQQGNVSKMQPNAWVGVSNQQNSLAVQPSSNVLMANLKSTNNSETNFSSPYKPDDQISAKGDCGSSAFAAYSVGRGIVGERQSANEQEVSAENDASQKSKRYTDLEGKESIANHFSGAPPSNYVPTQRDIEAFGRSLRPNNVLHQNYSLLHQMQAMKNAGTDADNRSAKRFKGSESNMDATMIRDAPTNLGSHSSVDPKMLSLSSKSRDNLESNVSLHMLASGRTVSQSSPDSNSVVAVRGEHPKISPQMAPSWFDQYGTLKDTQVLPINEARTTVGMKNMEQPFLVGKPSDIVHGSQSMPANASADTTQPGNVNPISSHVTGAAEHHSSPQLLPPASADQNLALVRPKKRKTETSELIPWHREVMQGVKTLQNISMAEVEWARATNRLLDKVEFESELIEEPLVPNRSRRRFILTTQLMQQLLCPPPPQVLYSEASSQFENVMYLVARSALRDACSSISDTSVRPEGENVGSENLKSAMKVGDESIAKALEDFIGRAKKLEENLFILDKRASILDLRVECQDLEKFSVINRFAKFHGRGQADGVETSSSADASANAQRSCPQRYVTALPMPRNVPDRVQCLLL